MILLGLKLKASLIRHVRRFYLLSLSILTVLFSTTVGFVLTIKVVSQIGVILNKIREARDSTECDQSETLHDANRI